MEYLEITVTVPEESKEALIYRMGALGAMGFIEESGKITAYYAPCSAPAEICHELMEFRSVLASSGLDSALSCSFKVLPDRDWNEAWKKNFTPIDIGERLIIIPSWLQVETDRIPIIIDPGMVFGTGHHETTQTCLILIEQLAKRSFRRSLLDIGTGTGILAIAAARLGFERVIALDIDPLALDAAARNIAANGLKTIDVSEGTIATVDGTFDVIVANLLSETLTAIASELSQRLQPNGTAILSGLLAGQDDGVIVAMDAAGLFCRERVVDNKWVSLICSKNPE